MTLAVLVATLGVLASVGAGAALAVGQKGVAEQQLDRRATLVAEAATGETSRYVDTLRAVAAATGALERLTADGFAKIADPVTDRRLAGATSVAFLVPAADEQIESVQAHWRANGDPDLALVPAGRGPEHIFSIFSQPLDGATAIARGIDVTQSAPPTQALIESRRLGEVTISTPYRLIRDQALPLDQQQMSFVLTAPVYVGGAGGSRSFRGWILMGLRGQDFVGGRLRGVAQDLVDVELRAPATDGALVSVAALRASVQGRRDVSRSMDVAVAQQTWQLQVRANGQLLPGAASGLPTAWTISGCVLSLLLAGLVFVLASGRARARAQVAEATAGLRQAETQARNQAELLTAILESISDGVGVIDQDGRSLLSNPVARRLLGGGYVLGDKDAAQPQYGVYQVDGLSPVRASDMPLARALAGEFVDGMEMVIWDDDQPEGVFLSVSARPLAASSGQRGAVAVLHDITAQKRHERQLTATAQRLADELILREETENELRAARDELAAREAYLADVIDSVDVAIAICDTNGRITRSNRVAKQIAGAGPVGATVEHASARVNAVIGAAHSSAEPVNPLLAALTGVEVQDQEVTIAPPGRPQRTLLVHARPLHGADGQIIGAVSSAADITTVREQQAELAAFAGVVAHDLKSPLTAVAGFTDIIDEELEAGRHDPAVLRPLVTRVMSGVTRMRKLIDDLLVYAMARDGAIQLSTVDLRVVADEAVGAQLDDAAPGSAASPDVYVGQLPLVHGDLGMLRQLMRNLISNAIKYTPPGRTPRVDITARADEPGWIRVEVADRGIGIPAGQHQAIFAGFHRAHPAAGHPGTGLGLSICQRIVQRHGGTITATDNPGGGTRIKLTLPADPGSTESAGRRPVMSSAPPS